MYRVGKVLNHNAMIVISTENKEFLVMGKGIGFGKKVSERIHLPEDISMYALEETTRRGSARELVRNISPEYLEIANHVLEDAEKRFQTVDKSVLFAMADHIEYAVKRIRENESISNPLTDDIRLLFKQEYEAAKCVVPLLKTKMGIDINEDEIGYIALHVHTAIDKGEISEAMKTAQGVRECISYVENHLHRTLDSQSISYHRLMNHVRYMILRGLKGETIKLNMNDYMEVKFPKEFEISKKICNQLSDSLKCTFTEAEIGYLAMHLQRVIADEEARS